MTLENEFQHLERYLSESLSDSGNYISDDICSCLCSKSKRIRSMLIFLFSRVFKREITEKIYHLACAVELIHNAALIHDDIIDNADVRRGVISFNHKFGGSLSLLSGDIMLSAALKELVNCESIDIINLFSKSLYLMCRGEINQNCSLGKVLPLSEYINNSECKTAELFKAALEALCILCNPPVRNKIGLFAKNFGIAFQIRDDLLNILKTDKSKPALSDIHNGIYTSSVIYLNEERGDVENLSKSEIINMVSSDKKYINKSAGLIKHYAQTAVTAINFIKDSEYKREIINITENLYKAGINE